MRLLVVFATISALIGIANGQESDFYEQVLLRVECRTCYFVAVNVDAKDYKGRVVVENDKLFDYLRSTKRLNKRSYFAFVSKLIRDSSELKMADAKIDETGAFLEGRFLKKASFRIVKKSESFDAVSAQGCANFIRFYFSVPSEGAQNSHFGTCKEAIKQSGKDLFIRPRFDLNEQANVISKLFDEEIPIYLDEFSGSLRIWSGDR